MTDNNPISKIPRHPLDPNIAYGYDLDRALVANLVRERLLLGAIFRSYVSPEEIAAHATPDVSAGFRQACGHFTHFFLSSEKGMSTTLDSGIAVMRGLGDRRGCSIDTMGEYNGGRSLVDFFPNHDDWLVQKIIGLGQYTCNGMGDYGYHIFHAPAGRTERGYAAKWHTHDDITSSLTLGGATMECLPSDVDITDANVHPEQYEDRIIRPDIGDAVLIGRMIHRSSHRIPEEGQFAVITHGPWCGND
ncbi:MAG: hypothetical protein H6858_05925 [Rhodospirillales bacterium]|nr:hypothetical protein [Alphaproteobacteria bacterium]MCB9977114.1 hypothetical protein [Rhodospirillales bacterium]